MRLLRYIAFLNLFMSTSQRQTGNNGREGDKRPDFPDSATMWYAYNTTALHFIFERLENIQL